MSKKTHTTSPPENSAEIEGEKSWSIEHTIKRIQSLNLEATVGTFAPNMRGRFHFSDFGNPANYDINGGDLFTYGKESWIASGVATGTHGNSPATTAWSIEYDAETKKLTWGAIFTSAVFDMAAPDAPFQLKYNPQDSSLIFISRAHQVNFGQPNKKILMGSYLSLTKCSG